MVDTQLYVQSRNITRAVSLIAALGLALLIPNLGMSQYVTGPLVNALLLIVALQLGTTSAVVVGIVTPMAALLRGVLPLPLALMIPFIALGNAAFVTLFGRLAARNRLLALGLAAVLKFALLQSAVLLLSARPLALVAGQGTVSAAIPSALAAMMSWPQLFTALAGGAIALGIDGLLRARRAND